MFIDWNRKQFTGISCEIANITDISKLYMYYILQRVGNKNSDAPAYNSMSPKFKMSVHDCC